MSEKASLDQIIQEFDPAKYKATERIEGAPLTLWLPKTYREKYRMLQRMSKLAFGKKLQELVMAAIDRAESKAS